MQAPVGQAHQPCSALRRIPSRKSSLAHVCGRRKGTGPGAPRRIDCRTCCSDGPPCGISGTPCRTCSSIHPLAEVECYLWPNPADALLATGRAPQEGCITSSRSLKCTLPQSCYVRYRSLAWRFAIRVIPIASSSKLLRMGRIIRGVGGWLVRPSCVRRCRGESACRSSRPELGTACGNAPAIPPSSVIDLSPSYSTTSWTAEARPP